MPGADPSLTLTEKLQIDDRPLTESVKVYDTSVTPKQNSEPDDKPADGLLSAIGTLIDNPSLSVAEGADHVTAVQFEPTAETEISLGHEVMVGAEGAKTDTVNRQLPVLPAASDAVHATDVVPTSNACGRETLQEGPEVTPTLSEAVGVEP